MNLLCLRLLVALIFLFGLGDERGKTTHKILPIRLSNATLNHFASYGDNFTCISKGTGGSSLIEVYPLSGMTKVLVKHLDYTPALIDMRSRAYYTIQRGRINNYDFGGRLHRSYKTRNSTAVLGVYQFRNELYALYVHDVRMNNNIFVRYEVADLISDRTLFAKNLRIESEPTKLRDFYLTSINDSSYACCFEDSLVVTIFGVKGDSKELINPSFKYTKYTEEEFNALNPTMKSLVQMSHNFYPMVIHKIFTFENRIFVLRKLRPNETIVHLDVFSTNTFLKTVAFSIDPGKNFVDLVSLRSKLLLVCTDENNRYYLRDISGYCY